MPLNATLLGTALESAIKGISAEDDDTRKEIAKAIATEVVNHIVANAQVTVLAGIPVATAGSPTAQTGATTAPGTGTIS